MSRTERTIRCDETAAKMLIAVLLCAACRTEKFIRGTIVDYDTGLPIAHARALVAQTGWGMSSNGVVWDKSFPTEAFSDADGRFLVRYRVGSSASMRFDLDGYNTYRTWQEPNATVTVRLRRLASIDLPLSSGQLHLGRRRRSGYYGWSFVAKSIASDCKDADIVADSITEDRHAPIHFHSCGLGGIRFVPAESLRVENSFLVYADSAPVEGYETSAVLDFRSRGGVYFVRTRDGAHYAKFEFQPNGAGGLAGPDVVRDLMLEFVYGPTGSRWLPYNVWSGG